MKVWPWIGGQGMSGGRGNWNLAYEGRVWSPNEAHGIVPVMPQCRVGNQSTRIFWLSLVS